MKKTLLFVFSLFLTSMLHAQVLKTVTNVTAGGLQNSLTTTELAEVTNLTITGTLDARDFVTLRDKMAVLAVLDLSGATISAYNGPLGTNPDITSYPANELPHYAFCKNTTGYSNIKLKSVIFASTISSIGKNAFYGCRFLSIPFTIPESILNIGENAFMLSKGYFEVVALNPNYSSLDGTIYNKGKTTLIQCSTSKMGTFTIPSSVTSIRENAFYSCVHLYGNLIISESILSIGFNAFKSTSFFYDVDSANPNYSSLDGILYDKNKTLLINCSTSRIDELAIPTTVKTIGESAFSGCNNITGELIFPNSLTTIRDNAFSGCSQLSGTLSIPISVDSIGASAFSWCSGFTGDLTIPNSVKYLGAGSFWGCSGFNGSLTLSTQLKSIADDTFIDCSGLIGNINIPSSVESIGIWAFGDCSGFSGNLVIPNSVKSIGADAFLRCTGLDGTLTIPNSVTNIEYQAFADCSGLIGDLSIPNSVTKIPEYAFAGCSSFSTLIIPSTVSSIEEGAFSGCSNLLTINNFGVNPIDLTLSPYTFNGVNTTNCVLNVPYNTKAEYQKANQWLEFNNIVEMTPTILKMQDNMEYLTIYPNPTTDNISISGIKGIAEVSIISANGVKLIEQKIENNCSITTTEIPNGIYIVRISDVNGTQEHKLVKK